MSRRRQTAVFSGVPVDNHLELEAIYNQGGDIIAYRCKACTKIMCHVGRCSGCGTQGTKLTAFASRKRFCTEECLRRWRARERKVA